MRRQHWCVLVLAFLISIPALAGGPISSSAGRVDRVDVLRRANRSTVEIHAAAVTPKYVHHSRGAGVIVSSDGYIVTAYHVIRDCDRIGIQTIDGSQMRAEVVAVEEGVDIAVLKASSSTVFEPASIASTSRIQAGRSAIVIGNPGGGGQSVIRGKLGGTRVVVWDGNRAPLRCIEADVVPGNSGGGAFDLETGELLGVTVAKSATMESIGYVVPANEVAEIVGSRVAASDINDHRVIHENIGATLRPVTLSDGRFAVGLLVTSVRQGSPAAAAGWTEGDVLIGMSKYQVKRPSDVLFAMAEQPSVDGSISFLLSRDSGVQTGVVQCRSASDPFSGPAVADRGTNGQTR